MATNLQELQVELEARKQAIEEETAPIQKKADEIRNKIQPLEAQLREYAQQVKKIEVEAGLADVSREIARIARARGARTIQNG